MDHFGIYTARQSECNEEQNVFIKQAFQTATKMIHIQIHIQKSKFFDPDQLMQTFTFYYRLYINRSQKKIGHRWK